jgi:hypothetical protein
MVIYLYRVSPLPSWESASGFIELVILVHSYVEKSWELLAQYEHYLLEFRHL